MTQLANTISKEVKKQKQRRHVNLTPAQYEELQGVVERTWQMIAGDMLEGLAVCGERTPSNTSLIDSCLDIAYGAHTCRANPYGMTLELAAAYYQANHTTVRRTLSKMMSLGV